MQAPPVEGKANAAVLKWAARTFGVRRHDVVLVQGERGSEKRVLVRGIALEAAASALTDCGKT